MLSKRANELGIKCPQDELILRVIRALRTKLENVFVHDSLHAFERVILALADRIFVRKDGSYTGFDVRDLDLWTNLDFAEATCPGDSARGGVFGSMALEPRTGTPAVATKVEVSAMIEVGRAGRTLWNVSFDDVEID